jgi:hypothetical protein
MEFIHPIGGGCARVKFQILSKMNVVDLTRSKRTKFCEGNLDNLLEEY